MANRFTAHPLKLVSILSFLGMLFCSLALPTGFTLTHAYPSETLQQLFVFSVLGITLLGILFVYALRANPWALRAFSFCIAALFILLLYHGNAMRINMETNPHSNASLLRFLIFCYYSNFACMLTCVNALHCRSEVHLDKSTIPFAVNLSGLMMFVIGLTYSARFLILYTSDIPLYRHSSYALVFVIIAITFNIWQYFGKFGPLYRTRGGQHAFTLLSIYLGVLSLAHIFFYPILNHFVPIKLYFIQYLQFSADQVDYMHHINSLAAIVELIACATIFFAMRRTETNRYYQQFAKKAV